MRIGRFATWARWSWSVAALVVLLAAQYFYDGRPNSDADLLLAYGMFALSFPTSVLVGILSLLC